MKHSEVSHSTTRLFHGQPLSKHHSSNSNDETEQEAKALCHFFTLHFTQEHLAFPQET